MQVRLETLAEKTKNQKTQIERLEQEVLQGYSGTNSPARGSMENIMTDPGPAPVDSVLKIVCTQRDRFQAKIQKLESVRFFECQTSVGINVTTEQGRISTTNPIFKLRIVTTSVRQCEIVSEDSIPGEL